MGHDERKLSKLSKKFIAFIGYWWITLSVLIAIWQLFDFVYEYKIPEPWNWISIIGIILLSLVIAIVLTCSFPFILDVLFDKISSEEKYFNIEKETELKNLQATICASISCMRDEEMLIETLKESCCNSQPNLSDYTKALGIGETNSKLLNCLDKNYLRIINGIYSLYALAKKNEKPRILQNRKQSSYLKHYFFINDIGWSLYELCDAEWEALKNRCSLFSSDIKNIVDQNLDFNLSSRQNGINILKKSIHTLSGQHPILIAQAYRHLLSFEECRQEDPKLFDKFVAAIKRVKNDEERKDMEGNSEYLQAKLKLKEFLTCADPERKSMIISEALECVNKADEKFIDVDDFSRRSKCFNLKGQILVKKGNIVDAEQCFKEGLSYSYNIQRYDQILLCLQSLVEMQCKDWERYAKDGLRISMKIRDRKHEAFFNSYCKVKHIFLIRHGESEKNLNKTVNGSGNLTQNGKEQIAGRIASIDNYLKEYGYSPNDIKLYGLNKLQIEQTIQTILEKWTSCHVKWDNDLLKPIDMGVLHGKQESDTTHIVFEQMKILNQWRNGDISVDRLNIDGMEPFAEYWEQARDFITSIMKENEKVNVVVCTASIAILLTHYLINSKMKPEEYRCIEFPLGGVVHFRWRIDSDKFEIANRNETTNIAFAEP